MKNAVHYQLAFGAGYELDLAYALAVVAAVPLDDARAGLSQCLVELLSESLS